MTKNQRAMRRAPPEGVQASTAEVTRFNEALGDLTPRNRRRLKRDLDGTLKKWAKTASNQS